MTIVVIPARLASSRLPNKPLAMINNVPMIIHVWQRAVEADIGPVYIAGCDLDLEECVKDYGANYVRTNPELPSGTDRVAAAIAELREDAQKQIVVNLQADLPWFEVSWLANVAKIAARPGVDIATLAAPITDNETSADSSVVKVVGTTTDKDMLRALYFTRAQAPWGTATLYQHCGIYAFASGALERFVSLPPSPLELSEKLEQLRALEAGMRIDVGIIDCLPVSVDTEQGLEHARRVLAN